MKQEIEFSKKFMDKFIGDTMKDISSRGFIKKIFYYIIDSKTRKQVKLNDFLYNQLLNPYIILGELLTIAHKFKHAFKDTDERIIEILKFVKSKVKYSYDQDNWNKVEYWADALETWTKKCDDCLMGDTPIVVNKQGRSDIIEIAELIPKDYPILDRYHSTDLKILGQGGFKEINWIIKKPTNKDIYRVRSGKSVIDVTEDHKIMCRDNRNNIFINAKDIKSKRIKTVIKPISSRFMNHNLDYDIGWVYGLFAAEGYCSKNKSTWRIYNTDRSLLEKAKTILNSRRLFKIRSLMFEIVEYKSFMKGAKTNLGERKKTLYVLRPKVKKRGILTYGSLNKFVKRFYTNFYTSLHNKKVPSQILNGSKEAKQGFLDGHYVGDKHYSTSKILMFGMMILFESLGKLNYKLNDKINRNMVIVKNKSDRKTKIRTSTCLGKTDKLVYDLNIGEPHYFAAGDIIVHNCDGINNLIWVIARLSGIQSLQLWSAIGDTSAGGHFWLLYFSTKRGQWYSIDGTFYPNFQSLKTRPPFIFKENKYKSIWAMFNDKFTYKSR